jgi:hypothetical protein
MIISKTNTDNAQQSEMFSRIGKGTAQFFAILNTDNKKKIKPSNPGQSNPSEKKPKEVRCLITLCKLLLN